MLTGPSATRPHPAGDLVDRHSGRLQTKHIAHLAHRGPLCRPPAPPVAKPMEPTLSRPAETPCDWCLARRHHPRMAGEIISERRARSLRIRGPTSLRNPHPAFDFEKLVDWHPKIEN